MTISQLVPFARSAGLGAAVATLALPVTAAGNAGGRILSGWLSDALGRVTTLRLMVLASAVAMPALFVWRDAGRCSSSCSWRACTGATARSCPSLRRRRPTCTARGTWA